MAAVPKTSASAVVESRIAPAPAAVENLCFREVGFAPFVQLPVIASGEVRFSKPTPALETTSLSPEEKRQPAAALLKKRLAASSR